MSAENSDAESGTSRRPYHEPKTVDELTARNVEVVAEPGRGRESQADAAGPRRGRHHRLLREHDVRLGRTSAVSASGSGPTSCTALKHFDPYPFQLLSMVVSLEAIFLSTFILISQNRQNRLAERRNHLICRSICLSEQENTKILTMVESIVRHLDIPDGDPEIGVLAASTEPERLVEQIEKVIENENRTGGNDGNEP